MKYTVIIEQGRESGYMAYVPALKGCVSQGETKEEALKNIKEAMEVYIEALLEDGLPVPVEVGRDTVELEVAAGTGLEPGLKLNSFPIATSQTVQGLTQHP